MFHLGMEAIPMTQRRKKAQAVSTTRRRRRLDETAKTNGWTHRVKNKSRDPYVKGRDGQTLYEGMSGAVFIDMDEKFRFIHFRDLTEL